MRSCPLQFEGRSCLISRVVLAFFLVATLCITPFVSASSTHSKGAAPSHAKRLYSSHSRRSRRQAELGRLKLEHERRARLHHRSRTYALNHRPSPSRRRTHSRTSRLSETLDQAHSDAPIDGENTPTETEPPTLESRSTDEKTASTGDAPATNKVPIFNTSIPTYMPVALRGSREVLVHQNIIADVEGLRRIQNDAQLSAMVRSGDLVALPASPGLAIDPRLPMNRRYARPWTAQFLRDLARAHEELFGQPLQLTSAVRTVNFQRRLSHYNGNAAPTSGDTASPHLTGEAIDLGKKGMSLKEIAWMRAVLGQLQASGKLDVEEEFEQACFHISVYETYQSRRTPPAQLDASNNAPSAPAATPARAVVVEPVRLPVRHSVHFDRGHSYYVHHVRRASYVHRRRHHRSMSLIAAGLR